MPVSEFKTWNPVLHIRTVQGNVPGEELRKRTLKLAFVSRLREFDHIEWEVMNHDGLLTQPSTMVAGMIVAIKLGYIDQTAPWRTFVVNRMRGGVGVSGRECASVGDGESTITLFGRNRNARGGQPRSPQGQSWEAGRGSARKWPEKDLTAKGKVRKPRKVHPSTGDMDATDMLLNRERSGGQSSKPRVIIARSTSKAVIQIAQRWGFREEQILVESTGDFLENMTVPAGRSDAEHLQILARDYGFQFFIDHQGVFHWHSVAYARDTANAGRPVEQFFYGGGPDILRIGIDADFTLPFAQSIKVSTAKRKVRGVLVQNMDGDAAIKAVGIGQGTISDLGMDGGPRATEQSRQLVKPYHLPAIPTDYGSAVWESIRRKYIRKLTDAFKLTINCVGNPRLLAGKIVEVAGTGSIFVDGPWMIGEARHTIQNSNSIVYGTDVQLQLAARPAGGKKSKGKVRVGSTGNLRLNRQNKTDERGTFTVDGYQSTGRSVAGEGGK